jgi:Bacterial Ig domain
MTQNNYARLIGVVLCLWAFCRQPLQAQIATHRLGAPINFQVSGQNTAAGFVQRYVLTNTAGTIQYSAASLPFTGVTAGQYKAYAVNYDGGQTAPNLTVGTAITAIGGSCVDTSDALKIGVLSCNNSTGNISATIAGQNMGAGFTQKYALTDSVGRILQVTNTPQYTNLASGIYNVYAVNYETASGVTGLAANQNIRGVGGSCVAISQPLGYIICLPTNEVANNGLDDDGDGLIDCHDPDVAPCPCTNTSSISFTHAGQNTTAGFTTKYVLTDSFGIIKQVVNTPSVSGLLIGKYRVYAVNYETASGISGLTVGQNISGVTGTCVQKSLPLLYNICSTAEIANNGFDDDGDGLIDCHDPDVAPCSCTTTTSITFNHAGQNATAGFTTKYVLTDSFGIIKQVVNTPSVSGLLDANKYRIYAVNYQTTGGATGLTVGQNISGVTGSCLAVSKPLLYRICLGAPREDICNDGIDNDSDGQADCNDNDCINTTIASITPSKSTICTGGASILTASGGGTYLWSTGATTPAVTVSDSGRYSVTVTRGTGCTDTAAFIIAKPYVEAFCKKTTIVEGVNGATLKAYNGATYVWSTGATSQSIYVNRAGTYTVTITGADGCQEVDSWTITAKQPVVVQCAQMPNYRLALGKDTWLNETYSWASLDGMPIVSRSAFDTSIVVNLSTGRPDSVYRFIQIATRYGMQDTDAIALKILDCNTKPMVVVTPQTVIEDSTKQICLTITDPNVGQTHSVSTNCTPTRGTISTPSVSGGQVCFTYTPNLNVNGQDTVCLIVCDNDPFTPKCDTVKVPITITPVNDAPVVTMITPIPIPEGTRTTFCGAIADVDAGDTHTATLICGATHGVATPSVSNGQVCVQYVPTAGFSGIDSVCIVVCDNGTPSKCDTVTVVMVVTPNPKAVNDFATTMKHTPVSGNVATNDNANGYVVTFAPITNSPNGILTMNPNGTYTFTPTTGFVGQVDYLYTICNNAGVCDTAKLAITVFEPTNGNDKPVANDDVVQTNKNIPVGGNVLNNDLDPDGDPMRVNPTPVAPPVNGSLVLNPNGSFTYTPNLNFVGKDSFEYIVCDPANICDVAKVVIYVNEDKNGVLANDPPNAQDDLATTLTNVPFTGSLRLNDSDPNAPNSTLTYTTTPLSNPTNGTLVIQPNGTYIYTPNPNFYGNDVFTYRVCDAGTPSLCDTATVFVTVVPPVPSAVNDINTTTRGNVAAGNLTANDSGNGLSFTINTTPTRQPANGSISISPNGNYIYTPNPSFTGADTIDYVICNTANICDTATLVVTVTGNPNTSNNPPIAQNDVAETFVNQQVTSSVLTNDFDMDNDPLTVTTTPLVPPQYGTLTLNANGTYTYLPNPNFTGVDSFKYQVCDNRGGCATSWAIIEVKNDQNGTANDRPLANDDAYSTNMGVAVTGTMKPNDTDPNNNTLIYTATPVVNPARGSVVIQPNGMFTYTPNAGFWGTDKFQYSVCDNGTPSLCDTATVFIVVPNRPLSVIDTATLSVPKDSTRSVCVAITDPDLGDIHAATLICNPTQGTATPSVSNGQVCVSYTPTAGFTGQDSVCVRVCDQAGNCDTVKIKINVIQTCVTVTLKVLLEGPYDVATGRMSTVLNQRGLLPGQTPIGLFAVPTPTGQPFNVAPWNYNGTEGDGFTAYPATVVDWVLISLRSSTAANSTVFRCAGLLHNDGTITFTKPCLTIPNGNYYILIEHRNHVGVMSPSTVAITNGVLNFDFTSGESYVLTNPPTWGQKAMSNGKWVMFAGDGKKDTQTANYDINFNDSQLWKVQSGIFDQYRYGDFNLDADVNFGDSQLWKRNNGRYSGVPH